MENQIEIAKQLMIGLLDRMDIQAEVEGSISEGSLVLEIKGDKDGILIGKHGRTLEAIQLLINRMVTQKLKEPVRVVVDIDHYEQLVEWHGTHVAELITRKLSKILSTKVRREDTVSQLGTSRFAVLSPSTDLIGCCAFALRLQRAMEKLVMTYREERIRISVTIGVSSSAVDGMSTVGHLIETASKRVDQGAAMGGNRVIADTGEVDQAMVDRSLKQVTSIDHALLQLRLGATDEVASRLPDIIATLYPLLQLVESHLHCGLPLVQLKQYEKGSGADNDDLEGTRTSI